MKPQLYAALLTLIMIPADAAGPVKGTMQMPTRDEYRQCLEDMDEIEEQRLSFHAALKRHEIVARDIKLLQDIHVYLLARVNTGDQVAVGTFNRKVEVLNQRSLIASAESTRLQRRQFDINEAAIAINLRCAGKSTPAADQEAVLIERLQRVSTK